MFVFLLTYLYCLWFNALWYWFGLCSAGDCFVVLLSRWLGCCFCLRLCFVLVVLIVLYSFVFLV